MSKQAPTKSRAIAELLSSVTDRNSGRGFAAGLHAAQWEALRYFNRANESARTVTGFAQARGTTQGTATQTVSALVRKGLLKRYTRPDDRRSARLDLTDSGRKHLEADPFHNLVDAVNRLSVDDREALAKGLIALHQWFQRSSE